MEFQEEEDSGFQRKSLKNKFELECEDSNIEMPPKFRNLQPWATRKEEILSQFNSHEVLSMTSWFSLQDKSNSDLSFLLFYNKENFI